MTDSTANNSAPATLPRDAAGLFRELVLLDRNEHRGFRFKPTTDWSRARAINAVPVAAGEFAEVTREMPVAFVSSGEKSANGHPQVLPIALLGLREAENLFVREDGSWDGRFVPAALRRYPFGMVRTGDDLSMVVDQQYEGWMKSDSADAGDMVVDAEGQPTEFAKTLLGFLNQFETEMHKTRLMCDRLVELELLRGAEVSGDLPGGGTIKADGFFMVDADKFSKLPDDVVLEMHRNGLLGLLHMHMHSMGNVQLLAERVARQGLAG